MSKVQNPAELVAKWWEVRNQVKALEEVENQLRLQIAQEGFGYDPNQLQKGSKKCDYPGEEDEFVLKCDFRVNESVDKNQVQACINELQANGVPAAVIAELFSWTPKLKQTGYKMIPDHLKPYVDAIVTRYPGMPAISKVEKKKKQSAEVRQSFAVARGK